MKKIRSSFSIILAVIMVLSVFVVVPITSSAAEDYRAWAQTDSRWASIRLGSSAYTIGSDGCLVSSVTKLIIQAGFRSQNSFNIGTLGNWLNSHGGYDKNGGLYWAKPSACVSGFNYYGNLLNYGNYNSSTYNNQLVSWVKQGYHITLQVNSGGHWIAIDEAKTKATGQVYIMDSSYSVRADLALVSRYGTFNRAVAYIGGSSPTPVNYVKPEIVKAYINYQTATSYRVNVVVKNPQCIESVRLATWTNQAQTDLHWNNCHFNSYDIYFYDISRSDYAKNAKCYFNDAYVRDIKGQDIGSIRVTTTYADPKITNTYINYQKKDSYRVNVQVEKRESIASVRVATWTAQNQSDLHWNYCHFNGYDTYFFDLSRSDFEKGQKVYINDIYIYDANEKILGSQRVFTEYKDAKLEDIRVIKLSSKGYKVVAKVDSQFRISSAKVPTWTLLNDQDDLVWHSAEVAGKYISCYINASDHKNEKNNYISHLYIYDSIGQTFSFGNILPYINLNDEIKEVDFASYNNHKYILYNHDFSWTEAKEWCESQGGHLATISDGNEWEAVKSLLSKNGGIPVWLGGQRINNNLTWVDNTPFSFNDSWEENQPDNANGTENYLGTHHGERFLDCFLWNDYENNHAKIGGFVCEYDTPNVTEQPTTEQTEPESGIVVPSTEETKPESEITAPTNEPETNESQTVDTIPVVTEPNSTEDVTEQITETITTEPTEPMSTAPIVTDPITTEPAVTEPVGTDPIDTEPVTTEPTEPITPPVVTDPITTEPFVTEPITPPVVTDPTQPSIPKPTLPKVTAKKANPIKVSVKTKTVKLKKLKKKAQKVKAIKVKNNIGKVTYKLVKKGITKKIRKLCKINSKGVITIKKWKKAMKGTYKIKVKVTAAGNSNYNAKAITKTIRIKIK